MHALLARQGLDSLSVKPILAHNSRTKTLERPEPTGKFSILPVTRGPVFGQKVKGEGHKATSCSDN